MGDPFSVVGSAVGVVSLGITVCQRLVTYYTSWKGYDDDIRSTCQYLDGVTDSLQHLQTCLQNQNFPGLAKQQVEAAMVACDSDIQDLRKRLDKIRCMQLPSNIRGRFDTHLRRAQYPFKICTLKKLKENVASLQTNVQLAISLLGLDILVPIDKQISTIAPEIAASRQDIGIMSSNLGSVQTIVESLDQTMPALRNDTSTLISSTYGLHGQLAGISSRLQDSDANIALLPMIHEELATLPSSLARSVAIQLEVHGRECHRIMQQEDSSDANIVRKLNVLEHEIKKLQLQTISKPGFMQSMCNELTSSNFVHHDKYLLGQTRRETETSIGRLRRLFEDGQAAPDDVDVKGRTVLQLAVECLELPLESSEEIRSINMILGVASLGVPVNHKDYSGSDVLSRPMALYYPLLYYPHIAVQRQDMPHLLSKYAPALPEVNIEAMYLFQNFRRHDDYADAYNCGALSDAILARSESGVNRCLAKFSLTKDEQNRLGQTPLHLSADWPWCISRLLAAGANVNMTDNEGYLPISYASKFQCLDAVELLIAAGSRILPSHWWPSPMTLCNNEIFHGLFAALADQRKRLAHLAEEVLPPSQYSLLVSSRLGLLDLHAYKVHQMIEDAGIEIPPALQIRADYVSMYHSIGPYASRQQLDAIYDAGFIDVDVCDSQRSTPLMIVLEICAMNQFDTIYDWYISKGADPLRKITDFGDVSLHSFARQLCHWSRYCNPSDPLDQKTFRLVHILYQSRFQAKDYCNCKCCSDGCYPFYVYLKSSISWKNSEMDGEKSTINWILRTLLWTTVSDMQYNEIIRLILFTELGLTHTCCDWSRGFSCNHKPTRPSSDAISEIHEEEKELISELESLYNEAITRRLQYEGDFVEFIEGFLLEIRGRERRPISDVELARIEEIGVVLGLETVVRYPGVEEEEDEECREDDENEEDDKNEEDDENADAQSRKGPIDEQDDDDDETYEEAFETLGSE